QINAIARPQSGFFAYGFCRAELNRQRQRPGAFCGGMRKGAVGIFAAALLAVGVHGDDWPQWLGPKRDGVWRESGIVEKLPEKFSYKWRTPIGGGQFAQNLKRRKA